MYQQVFARWDCVDSRASEARAPAIAASSVSMYLYLCVAGGRAHVRKYATCRIGGALSLSLSFSPGGPVQKKPQTKHTQHYTYCRLIRPLGRRSPRVRGIWFRGERAERQLLTFLLPPRCSLLWDKLTEGLREAEVRAEWSTTWIRSHLKLGSYFGLTSF